MMTQQQPHPQPQTSTSKGFNHHNEMTLWMGDIDSLMDERFIKTSFNLMGEKVQQVKVVRDRVNGLPVGFGFVSFENEETARRVFKDINGKQIPNAAEGKRFRLNFTMDKERRNNEFKVFVGDLSPDVDDISLLAAFQARYNSTCDAKVVMDRENGVSKGFGYVNFTAQSDFRSALEDSHSKPVMIGNKAIFVKIARKRQYQPFNQHNEHYHGHHRDNTNQYRNSKRDVHSFAQHNTHSAQTSDSLSPESGYSPDPQMVSYANNNYNLMYSAVNPMSGISGYQVFPYMLPNNGSYPCYTTPYLPLDAQQYGQQYGQMQYMNMPICVDNSVFYPGMYSASQTLVDHGHGQPIDTVKLNEEMMAKNEDLYSSIDHSRYHSMSQGGDGK